MNFDYNNFFEINMIKDYNSNKMKHITENEVMFLKRYIPNKNSKVLDIMCGYGRLANSLYNEGYLNITGVDVDDYLFIPEKKLFKFIKTDYFNNNLKDIYDFCYSIYNSYPNINSFLEVIDRCENNIEKNGILIIDIFSKEWRDRLEKYSKRTLIDNKDFLVELEREYDEEYETSRYCIFNRNTDEKKEYQYKQCVISRDKLLECIPSNWDATILNSKEEKTRDDDQKHILVLKRR